jgi:glycosyltransferase involved in cell wall biosynthesis
VKNSGTFKIPLRDSPRQSRLKRLILWAQRRDWPLPASVRSAARIWLRKFLQANSDRSPVEDWSSPLIAGRITSFDAPPEAPCISGLLSVAADAASEQVSAARGVLTGSTDPLRCLIVTAVLDAGGIDEFVGFLARQLPTWGVDVTVMCASSQAVPARIGRLATVLAREGISVIGALPEEGRKWLAVNRPDVISAHSAPESIFEAASALGIPVVETLHGIPTPIGTDWGNEVTRSRYITSIVAVSDLVRRQYLRGNPRFPDTEIVTIPNAFNASHRPEINRREARAWLGLNDEFLFISLARQVSQKNAYGLVAAFADVARAIPRAHLLIAGRPDDLPYVEQVRLLRDNLPERNRIHLRDNLSDPSPLLAAADAFVLNSFVEGWPLASMEALCAGLPVIMSEVGGSREQAGLDGQRGYLVPNPLGDPETVTWESIGRERFRPHANKSALVAAMKSVISESEHWAAVRPRLARESRGRFSVQLCAEQHARILRRAAAGQTASGGRDSAETDATT